MVCGGSGGSAKVAAGRTAWGCLGIGDDGLQGKWGCGVDSYWFCTNILFVQL